MINDLLDLAHLLLTNTTFHSHNVPIITSQLVWQQTSLLANLSFELSKNTHNTGTSGKTLLHLAKSGTKR